MAIITKASKGAALTFAEFDNNWNYINNTKVEKSGTPTENNVAKWDSSTTVSDGGETITSLRNADNHTEGTINALFTATHRIKLTSCKNMKLYGAWKYNPQTTVLDPTTSGVYTYPNIMVVTHNIGHTNYVPIVVGENNDGACLVCTLKSENTATFKGWLPNGTPWMFGVYVVFYY